MIVQHVRQALVASGINITVYTASIYSSFRVHLLQIERNACKADVNLRRILLVRALTTVPPTTEAESDHTANQVGISPAIPATRRMHQRFTHTLRCMLPISR